MQAIPSPSGVSNHDVQLSDNQISRVKADSTLVSISASRQGYNVTIGHSFAGRGFFILKIPFLSMKRLYRSRKERILGGVCGGLGEHIDVDPTIIRLVWVVVTLLSFGTGIIVYLIAWIIIPESHDESTMLTTVTDA
jgi:phage shock protein C